MAQRTKPPAKRGRPALPPERGKRYAIGFRTTKNLKELLEYTADSSGRSLAQEIEFRLERTFDQVSGAFGGLRTAGVFRVMAGLKEFEGVEDDTWLDDRETFDLIVLRWNEYLESIRPKPTIENKRSP